MVDYSNTIIYKISCKDISVNELYIDHTVDFVARKKSHINACNKKNHESHNYKVYQTIRNNGGWDNWTMNIVAFYNCKNLEEATQIEQIYYDLLGGTLNSVQPNPKINKLKEIKQDYFCESCNIIINGINKYNIHIKSKKHTNSENINIKNNSNKNILKYNHYRYICNNCNFNSNNKNDWSKHIITKKHIKNINGINKKEYICNNCNKRYRSNNGLWKHKKKCTNV